MVMSLHMIKTYLFQLVLFIYGRHASCGTPVQATSANPPTLFLALEGVARSTEAAAKVAAAGGAKLTAAHLADQRFLRAGGCSRAGFLPPTESGLAAWRPTPLGAARGDGLALPLPVSACDRPIQCPCCKLQKGQEGCCKL